MQPQASSSGTERACPKCGAIYTDPELRFCKMDGAALVTGGTDPLIGAVVGDRYRLLSCLGEGGMGAVYSAEHAVMQRRVAVKVVRGDLIGDPVIARRFLREAQLAARITAPEVVHIYDSGVDHEGRIFIAMELLVGRTLRARIEDGPIPIPEALAIAKAVLRALDAAHGAGVVHRDLKPDNIFLCSDGAVKVLDFGIARAFGEADGDVRVTTTGAIVGTALYISPEAAARRAVGPAADLYALGAILFEMITGQPVFYDEHAVLLMGMHLRASPPTLSERLGRPVPDALEHAVAALLEKKPEARPPSARDALALLSGAAHGSPAPPRKKGRLAAVIVACALVPIIALSIGVGAWFLRADDVESVRVAAPPMRVEVPEQAAAPPMRVEVPQPQAAVPVAPAAPVEPAAVVRRVRSARRASVVHPAIPTPVPLVQPQPAPASPPPATPHYLRDYEHK